MIRRKYWLKRPKKEKNEDEAGTKTKEPNTTNQATNKIEAHPSQHEKVHHIPEIKKRE